MHRVGLADAQSLLPVPEPLQEINAVVHEGLLGRQVISQLRYRGMKVWGEWVVGTAQTTAVQQLVIMEG